MYSFAIITATALFAGILSSSLASASSQGQYMHDNYASHFAGLSKNLKFNQCMVDLDKHLRTKASTHKYYNSLLLTPKLVTEYERLGMPNGGTPFGFAATVSWTASMRENWAAYSLAFTKPKSALVAPKKPFLMANRGTEGRSCRRGTVIEVNAEDDDEGKGMEEEEEDLGQAGITYMLYLMQAEDQVKVKIMDDEELIVDFVCDL